MKLWLNSKRRLGLQLFSLTLILLLFGLFMIYSASVAEALKTFGDKFYFVKQQLKWTSLGLILMFFFSRLSLKTLRRFAPQILVFGLVLLVLVLIPGIGSKLHGARRWLIFPFFTLQPSELMKLIEIIYLSVFLNSKSVSFGQFLVFIGSIAFLVLLQPDMGTTLVLLSSAVAVYFLAGYPLKQIIFLALAGGVALLVLILVSPYRASRLKTFLDPMHDPLGSSYHIRQILLAFGSGGLSGVGLGKSRQKHNYLPESTTDSIFAVIGEELGFLGGVALIALFTYFIHLGFAIAERTQDKFARTLAGGITSWFAVQVVLNLASMVALTPLTGIPLPLVSYGGSALVTMLSGIGLLINISHHN